MPAPAPRPRKLSEIKSSLLQPSLTSHYECYFNMPPDVKKFLDDKVKAGAAIKGYDANKLSLLCSEASLPGSSLATIEINNDYSGVTQRHAYRRLYDDRADFTFYVDVDYSPISNFEIWMQYISDEQFTGTVRPGLDEPNYFYRFNYPDGTGKANNNGQGKSGYRTEIYINKFEKNYTGSGLTYKFLEAYPISINSMPVSYEGSQLLKCTVSFTYTRYTIETFNIKDPNEPAASQANPNTDPRSPGNPGSRNILGNTQAELDALQRQAFVTSTQGRTFRSPAAQEIVNQEIYSVLNE